MALQILVRQVKDVLRYLRIPPPAKASLWSHIEIIIMTSLFSTLTAAKGLLLPQVTSQTDKDRKRLKQSFQSLRLPSCSCVSYPTSAGVCCVFLSECLPAQLLFQFECILRNLTIFSCQTVGCKKCRSSFSSLLFLFTIGVVWTTISVISLDNKFFLLRWKTSFLC